MPIRVLGLSHLPLQRVSAGQPFQLLAELSAASSGPAGVEVKLEKQRITVNDGGFLELRPTGGDYFAVGPQPIKIADGDIHGISAGIVVRPDAKDGDTGEAVKFPDSLVFTAFVGPLAVPFTYHIIIIDDVVTSDSVGDEPHAGKRRGSVASAG
jgi:hypothetical protein